MGTDGTPTDRDTVLDRDAVLDRGTVSGRDAVFDQEPVPDGNTVPDGHTGSDRGIMLDRDTVLNRDTVAARVAGFPRLAADRADLKQAAVVVCVTVYDGVPCLLLTRRSLRLRAHAGQWALPGGRRDGGETAIAGALRELAEEVGLVLGAGSVLGLLDDYVTRSGYVMTPVVCWAGPAGELSGSEAEVASVHQVPVGSLDVEPRLVSIPESDAPVIQLPLLGGYLHAPTAAIVHQFCRIACRGEVHRVAHYEQPVFAWR